MEGLKWSREKQDIHLKNKSQTIKKIYECLVKGPSGPHRLNFWSHEKVVAISSYDFNIMKDLDKETSFWHAQFLEKNNESESEVAKSCPTLCNPMAMGFSRQEYWSGLPFPSPEDFPDTEIEPRSPALQADSLPSEPPGGSQSAVISHWFPFAISCWRMHLY